MAKKKTAPKKKKPAAKKKAAPKKKPAAKKMQAKMTCPECKHCQTMAMPSGKCTTSYPCKGCGKDIKAKECCVFCDYSNMGCCGCTTKKPKKR